MWLLESDGDLFGGKKKWLKPGQKYLFGRTRTDPQPGEQFHAINSKSVSRKHLVISVGAVPRGQGNHLYEKSELTVTDDSKFGTRVDGNELKQESQILSAKSHTIKLGKYEQVFRISWRPVVLTFSYTIKEQKRVDDILAPFREKLEPFDVKTILTYSIIDTTIVIANKRNIQKCLLALINGKYVVKESFINAFVKVCSSPDSTANGATPIPSPLEEDFDLNWPDALLYVPDPGKEPVVRPPEYFAPDSNRITLFEGFTFIFADEVQHEQLSPVVTNAGAKAVKFDLKLGETDLDDLVEFVRNKAHEKGIKDLAQKDNSRKVVVVRFRGKGDTEQWAIDFLTNLDSALGQRSVEQNEFLDAILTNDAGPLHRALEEDADSAPVDTSATSRSRNQRTSEPPVNNSENQEVHRLQTDPKDNSESPSRADAKPVTRSRFRKPLTENRFKGFDDFDPSLIQKPKEEPEDSSATVDRTREDASLRSNQLRTPEDSQPLFVTDSQTPTETRKRQRSNDNPAAEESDDDIPAAAALKRRRLELGLAESMDVDTDQQKQPGKQQGQSGKGATVKKPSKPIDVRQETRARAEKADKDRAKRLGQDEDRPYEEHEDISKLRDLVLVEDMAVPERRPPQTRRENGSDRNGTPATETGQSSRWDERWNGLKNFKNFRRQGQSNAPAANRGRRTLVGLEEAKRKDFGIGEHYWLEPSASARRRGESTQSTLRGSAANPPGGHDDEEDDGSRAIADEAVGGAHEGDPLARRGVTVAANGSPVRRAGSAATTRGRAAATRGRGAAASAAAAAAVGATGKRARPTRQATQGTQAVVVDSDSSDEDELKFRFKRRRGG